MNHNVILIVASTAGYVSLVSQSILFFVMFGLNQATHVGLFYHICIAALLVSHVVFFSGYFLIGFILQHRLQKIASIALLGTALLLNIVFFYGSDLTTYFTNNSDFISTYYHLLQLHAIALVVFVFGIWGLRKQYYAVINPIIIISIANAVFSYSVFFSAFTWVLVPLFYYFSSKLFMGARNNFYTLNQLQAKSSK